MGATYNARMQLAPAAPKDIFSHRKYWAARFGTAPFLPMSRAEMDKLGWEECDIILVTGDAYVDHPSFGMAIVGRLLEAQGFRVGIIAQPDWHSVDPFRALGKPKLFFGVTAGNMDSMVNRYTSDRRLRSDDAYTPNAEGAKRPDRAVIVYSQRAREAYPDVPIVIGGIEASLRRIAHFDYWSEKVRRSVLVDAKADILVYGNAERAIVDIAHRLAARVTPDSITDIRGTAFLRAATPADWIEIDSTRIDTPGALNPPIDPYAMEGVTTKAAAPEAPKGAQVVRFIREVKNEDRARSVIRMPSYEAVANDPILYAHASRILHVESNPGNARALIQRHGDREVWINPPPIPLTMKEMDALYELPFMRLAHPSYKLPVPGFATIKDSIIVSRGCAGGCTFCGLGFHQGKFLSSRSVDSVLKEIRRLANSPTFRGTISDLGGPTANLYAAKNGHVDACKKCHRPSCLWPSICPHFGINEQPGIDLLKGARTQPGVKHVFVQSGIRMDVALRTPEYMKELVQNHVSGHMKVAPEHMHPEVLRRMRKPAGDFPAFMEKFFELSEAAVKEQYLVPYFISSFPGCTEKEMGAVEQFLKKEKWNLQQVQDFIPLPMTGSAAMYVTGLDINSELPIPVVKGAGDRERQKRMLRPNTDPRPRGIGRDREENLDRVD